MRLNKVPFSHKSLVENKGSKRVGGGPVKLEMGMDSSFGNLLGRSEAILFIILPLWWVIEEGWSFERINGVGMNRCAFPSLLYMP